MSQPLQSSLTVSGTGATPTSTSSSSTAPAPERTPGHAPERIGADLELEQRRERLSGLLRAGRGPARQDTGPIGPGGSGGSAGSGGGAGGGGGGGGGTGGLGPGAQPIQPMFADVEAWVTGFFARVFVRDLYNPQFKWCSQWWRHPEAIVRLEALWRSWEELRLSPTTGPGVWLREFLDVQLPQLTSERGPFAECSAISHRDQPSQLPLMPAEPGWWRRR